MKILILIPTLEAGDLIDAQLSKLGHLSSKVTVLIVDSSSTDDTIDIVKNYGYDYEIIKREEFNHATTRNIALRYTDVDFYLFLTQDALPCDDTLIEDISEPFSDPDVVVSYARHIPYRGADKIERFNRNTNYPKISKLKSKDDIESMGIKTFFSSNSCAMYRASYFREVGGFRDGVIMNEDMEFAMRAIMDGKIVSYTASARVYHSHMFTSAQIFMRYFDIGVFFRTNQDIKTNLQGYKAAESVGIRQAKDEIKFLLQKEKILIPKSLWFSSIKYVAFKMGYHYEKFPKPLRRLFSLHKYWHK
jgi:rhamnosyltransferase